MTSTIHPKPKPNLFRFATRELSQDAMLCWLLSWADVTHRVHSRELHQLGVSLIELMYEKAGAAFTPPVCVEVERQEANIDILCIVDGTVAIIVEDKVGTKQHSDQLPRYVDYVEKTLERFPIG